MIDSMRRFNACESAGGIVLSLAAVVALIVSNSPLEPLYRAFLGLRGGVRIGAEWLVLSKPLLLWVNELWMAVFFFVVGLEIKREVLVGELASVRQAALPAATAFGGMVVPALIYAALNHDDAIALRGWAIPAATEIAFALRHPDASRLARAGLAEGLSVGGGHHRRPRRHRRDRRVLHRAAFTAHVGGGGCRHCAARTAEPRQGHAHRPVRRHRTAGMRMRVEVGRLRDAGRCGDCDGDSDARRARRLAARERRACVASVGGVFGAADVCLRECRRELGRRLVRYPRAGRSAGYFARARARARARAGQGDRRVRRRMAVDPLDRLRAAGRLDDKTILRRVRAVRHRHHHEPVHRSAGVRRARPQPWKSRSSSACSACSAARWSLVAGALGAALLLSGSARAAR